MCLLRLSLSPCCARYHRSFCPKYWCTQNRYLYSCDIICFVVNNWTTCLFRGGKTIQYNMVGDLWQIVETDWLLPGDDIYTYYGLGICVWAWPLNVAHAFLRSFSLQPEWITFALSYGKGQTFPWCTVYCTYNCSSDGMKHECWSWLNALLKRERVVQY